MLLNSGEPACRAWGLGFDFGSFFFLKGETKENKHLNKNFNDCTKPAWFSVLTTLNTGCLFSRAPAWRQGCLLLWSLSSPTHKPLPPNTLVMVLPLICNPGFGHKTFAPATSLPGNLTIHQNNSWAELRPLHLKGSRDFKNELFISDLPKCLSQSATPGDPLEPLIRVLIHHHF